MEDELHLLRCRQQKVMELRAELVAALEAQGWSVDGWAAAHGVADGPEDEDGAVGEPEDGAADDLSSLSSLITTPRFSKPI